ncbi:hypothetical protein LTR53_006098 [Teratosphaeriaceae sp. CCFEE 6253]|nr:hypothetical protein LTR53_006098 [Teratosphaeriaceae sp. CCFEE 6253]
MNGHAITPVDYTARLESFRRSDSERDALVTDLLQKFEELQIRYNEKSDDLASEIETRRMWQGKARVSESALTQHKQVSGSNNFALCLLDGDGAVFQDYLLAMGNDGGADCAHQLHTELRNHLRTTYPESNVADWGIVVHVILNMQGLGNKLQACGIISTPNELVAFGRAFSLAQPLFSFIDVGGGKERADHKVRETLRLFMPNTHCKHLFFGPCHDNGYLPVLEPYRLDHDTASRLTLIETTPAEPAFLKLGLQRIRCPRVFRSESLPARPNGLASTYQATAPHQSHAMGSSFQPTLPIRTPIGMSASTATFVPVAPTKQNSSPSPAPSAESAAANSWASVGKSGANPGTTIDIASKKAPSRSFIHVNVNDERVDLPLPEWDPKANSRFDDRVRAQGKRMCNNYHLQGKCNAGEYCDYKHGPTLSPGEQLVLRHKVRNLSCPKDSACWDPKCILGHHCRSGKKDCYYASACKFASSHGMDTEPAKRVDEDGKEEWLSSYLEKYRK